MITETEHAGLAGCLEISNGDARAVVSFGFGPRILAYCLDGGENILGWHPGAEVHTEIGRWKPYGGHRLWVAPENMPLSYAPDNDAVDYVENGPLSLTLTQPVEHHGGTQKEMTVTMDDSGSGVTIGHRIYNRGDAAVMLSAWALTIMRPGGEAVVPNEPFAAYSPENLLPARTMALWPYTDLTDPRWKFEKDAIRLRVDDAMRSPQKFGVLNKQGWVGYSWQDLQFTKRFEYSADAAYPDMNSNVEVYTDGGFVEVETLSPIEKLAPSGCVEHFETWELEKI